MSGSGCLTDGRQGIAGKLDVGKSPLNGTVARAREPLRGLLRSGRKPLLFSGAVSLAAHVLLLATLHVPRASEVASPRFVMRLVEAPVGGVPEAAAAALAVPERRPQAAAAAQPAPAASGPVAARRAEQASAPKPQVFHPPEDVTRAPLARSAPRTGDAGAALKARRLAVTVWIDAAGRVQRAEVTRNEVSPALAQQLESAVLGVRFVPARREGERVAAEYRTLLCFDDAGNLDTASDECWQVEGTTPR